MPVIKPTQSPWLCIFVPLKSTRFFHINRWKTPCQLEFSLSWYFLLILLPEVERVFAAPPKPEVQLSWPFPLWMWSCHYWEIYMYGLFHTLTMKVYSVYVKLCIYFTSFIIKLFYINIICPHSASLVGDMVFKKLLWTSTFSFTLIAKNYK